MRSRIFPINVNDNLHHPYFQKGTRHFLIYNLDGSLTRPNSGFFIPPILYFDSLEFFLKKGNRKYRMSEHIKNVSIHPHKTEHFFVIGETGIEVKITFLVPEDFTGLIIKIRTNKPGGRLLIKTAFNFDYMWHLNRIRKYQLLEKKGTIIASSLVDKNLRCMIKSNRKLGLTRGNDIFSEFRNMNLFFMESHLERKQLGIQMKYLMDSQKRERIKKRTYEKHIFNTVSFKCPEKEINDAFLLAKHNIKILEHYQPGLGQGYLAGVPFFPEFFSRDILWSIPGIVMSGDFSNPRYSINLLTRHQAELKTETKSRGKIPHEIWLTGESNYYSYDSTLLFLYALYRYYIWTGDREFIKDIYPRILAAYHWIREHMRYGSMINKPEGFLRGTTWMDSYSRAETGIEMQALVVKSLRYLSEFSRIARKPEIRRECRELELTARNTLDNFWLGNYYADRRKKSKKYDDTFTVNQLVVLMLGLTTKKRAKKVFMEMVKKEMFSPLGIRTRAKKTKGYNPGHYHKGKIWPLCTGWASLAAFRYGFTTLGKLLLNIFPHYYTRYVPGFSPECLHGDRYSLKLSGTKFSKEKEHFTSFLQLWSSAIFIQSIIEGLWGIVPDPKTKTITVNPNMPRNWKSMSLKNLRIFDNLYNISVKRVDGKMVANVSQIPAKTRKKAGKA